MKQIEPYINVDEAIRALDNGGRFYNVLTHAEDGIIPQLFGACHSYLSREFDDDNVYVCVVRRDLSLHYCCGFYLYGDFRFGRYF